MANIQERTSKSGKTTYKVVVRLKGYPTQTATFDRKTDAKKWAQHTESAIRERRHFKTVEAKKHTLADLIDKYIKNILPLKPKSKKTQETQLSWWKAQIGAYTLADVTPILIAECRDKLLLETTYRGEKRNPATVVRYMAALSHAFTVATNEWGWMEDSPMRKVKKPTESRGRVRFLTEEERPKLLKACKESSNKQLYTVVVLALSTGMRFSEVMNLTWDAIDLKRKSIVLHETKNGEIRNVPLVGHALVMLKEISKVRRLDTKLLFPGKNPNKPAAIRKSWENALALAEIANFRFHDLRHSAASYLAMNGATLAEIADVLGHKTLAMVKRYAHLSEQHTSSVVARMNANIFGEIQDGREKSS